MSREFVLLERQAGKSTIHWDNGEPILEGDSLEEIADSLAAMTGEDVFAVDDEDDWGW